MMAFGLNCSAKEEEKRKKSDISSLRFLDLVYIVTTLYRETAFFLNCLLKFQTLTDKVAIIIFFNLRKNKLLKILFKPELPLSKKI